MSLIRLAVLLVALTLGIASCKSADLHGGRLRFDVLDEHEVSVDGWEAGVESIGYASDEKGYPAVVIRFEPSDLDVVREASSRVKGRTVAVLDPDTGKALVSGRCDASLAMNMFVGYAGQTLSTTVIEARIKRLRTIAARSSVSR